MLIFVIRRINIPLIDSTKYDKNHIFLKKVVIYII